MSSLPGLALATDVVTPEEETQLIGLIEACGPRRYPGDEQGGLSAISFGWQYDMSNGRFSPCAPFLRAQHSTDGAEALVNNLPDILGRGRRAARNAQGVNILVR